MYKIMINRIKVIATSIYFLNTNTIPTTQGLFQFTLLNRVSDQYHAIQAGPDYYLLAYFLVQSLAVAS
jgi:hypothetical protein